MTTAVSGPPGYRRLRTVRNIALVDGALIVALLVWGAVDYARRKDAQ